MQISLTYKKLEFEELKSKQFGDIQAVADTLDMGEISLLIDDPIVIINPAVFFFHPNHLGSSTMISDGSGYAYQLFLNLPFGETMAEQRLSGTLDNMYKFNGKELDSETGLYYYGARYYDPRTSIFLSVDPLTESTMTPYQYTYQNPVRYIDPTGMAAEGWGKKTGEDGKSTWEYSKHITKDNYKDLGYSEYHDSRSVFSTTNNIADGRYNYTLNADGTVQDSQGSSMGSKFTTGAGTTIWNLDRDNSMVGFARRAYMSGNYDPRYSPSTRFSIGRRTESETFYTFNNGLVNDTDGFGSDFMRPGDRVESLVLPPFGADAAGNALFRGLKFLGVLKEKQYNINLKVRIYDSDSLYSGAISRGSVFTKDTTIRLKGNFRETYGRKYEFERKYRTERFDNYLKR